MIALSIIAALTGGYAIGRIQEGCMKGGTLDLRVALGMKNAEVAQLKKVIYAINQNSSKSNIALFDTNRRVSGDW